MPRLSHPPIDLSSDIIKKLEQDLYFTRLTVLSLVPKPARAVINIFDFITIEDTHHWLSDLAADLIEIAEPLPSHPAFPEYRAVCPLCGGESSAVGARGFALPEGLRMHLEGSGRAAWCDVVQAAFGLGRAEWESRFHEPGSMARAEFERTLEKRRRKETQYQLHPYHPPRLIDEGLGYTPSRDAASMGAAVDRLSELGFENIGTSRVVTYVREANGAIVYADPREERAIVFRVFRNPIRTELSRHQQRHVPTAAFRLLDTKKKDLEAKWISGVAAALCSITPALRLVE